MIEVKMDVKKIVTDHVKGSIATSMTAIRGMNYGDVLLLTKNPEGNYFWSNINSAYSIGEADSKTIFKNEYQAVFRAFISGETIYQFKCIRDFTKWLYDNDRTCPEENKK